MNENMNQSLKQNIYKTLNQLDAPNNLNGRIYVEDALLLLCTDFERWQGKTMQLYFEVGVQHNNTAEAVSRGIRSLIDAVYRNNETQTVSELLQTRNNGRKLTNGQFLTALARCILEGENQYE